VAEQLLTVDERPGLEGIEERTVEVGGTEVVVQSLGAGPPLLVLHDELGFSGWLRWTRELAAERQLLVPLQPGFGRTPRVEWVADYRDLAAFYLRLARELGPGRLDVIGFSAGGYLAAELAAACPEAVGRLVLVAPLGVRPRQGEIFDFLAATARTHLAATVTRTDAPEVSAIYGGEMTPEAFELFEAARAETSRLGWEPFMFSPSLPYRLEAVEAKTLVVWGEADRVAPEDCARRYAECVPGARLATLPQVGHRPEIEATDAFVELVTTFLRTPAKDR
jgi:pimeloyl-ACP methyl ester carboxylesterase